MMPAALTRRAAELAERGEPYVCATVVRVQRPTSAKAGDTALVLGDGTIEGFVGGDCAEHSVREYALRVIETGDPVLLRIVPFAEEDAAAGEHGAVTVQNPCLSGGAIEVFLEPVLRAPRVLVEGDTPIVHALMRIGRELGLDMVGVDGVFEPRSEDLALVAAGHGREELPALRCALEAGLPYVGLVASRRRGDGVLGELRGDAVPEAQLARIDTPAGFDIGGRTPGEIALSILARIVEVRRAPALAPETAVDPICGMTVSVVPGALSASFEGEAFYFCGAGCKAAFEAQHAVSE
jgi:xanthine dehydrogenase accessory factor